MQLVVTTSGAVRCLYSELIDGRRVLLVDDVIATGVTVRADCRLVAREGSLVAENASILLMGPDPGVARLFTLARPLL